MSEVDSKTAEATPVRIILGTMTIGPAVGNKHVVDGAKNNPLPAYCQTPPSVAEEQLKALVAAAVALVRNGPEVGKVMIDTASAYQNNHTEKVLGDILARNPFLRDKISIHTKCNSQQFPHESLSKESVLAQANQSLANLQIKCIDIYYLHGPDIKTDMEETLDAIDELHTAGKIHEFGLSNYPAWKVAAVWYRCSERKMVLPTVYQGCYNALTRSVEFEGAACFRELGIRSYHYNPLGGGMLTGKYESIESELKESGRFGAASPISGAMYSARYWKQQYFDAIDIIRKACEEAKVQMAEAAIRWTLHHSVLSGKHFDGIIFGASSIEHCISNLAACAKGPLSTDVVLAYDQAWAVCRSASSPYFRGYGRVPGSSDLFLEMFQSVVPKTAV